MPRLLSGVPLSDDERDKNDGPNRPFVVAAVLFALVVFAYLFSSISVRIEALPAPQQVVGLLGVEPDRLFFDRIVFPPGDANRRSPGDESLIFFGVLAAAFLCAYYLPIRAKRGALVLWTSVAVGAIYGPRVLAGLLCGHLVVYLVLHPRRGIGLAAATGALGTLSVPSAAHWILQAGIAVLSAAAVAAAYRLVVLPMLSRPRVAPVLRTLAVQSAILTVLPGAFLGALRGSEVALNVGVILFFMQWLRVIFYHVDYKDGLVPKDLPLVDYFSVFLSPGVVPAWIAGMDIAQGYNYTTNNFLAENKNRLVFQGLRIWGIALLYLVFYGWFVATMDRAFGALGIPVYGLSMSRMVCDYAQGASPSSASILMTSVTEVISYLIGLGGLVHFKVGIWRVCGYRVDPYFNKPWLATNLVSFWSRFAFHYREFLVRAFYYPVFFRFFKRRPNLRILVATLSAAAFGNLIWGHVTERMFYDGLKWHWVVREMSTWPYFVGLGLGITVAQVYLLKKRKRRRAWTLDRWFAVDVLCAYVTLQYFALILLFRRPCGGRTSHWDLLKLILKGVGVDLT